MNYSKKQRPLNLLGLMEQNTMVIPQVQYEYKISALIRTPVNSTSS
jgi:hypothetical protein